MTGIAKPELGKNQHWIDSDLAKSILPRREAGAHKWGVGAVLVIAGSPTYTGAAWLASRAAGRAGAGLVMLASGRSVIGTISATIPEVVHVALPESDTQSGAKRLLERIDEHLNKVKAVVIGPGLGDDEASEALLSTLFGFGGKNQKTRDNIGFGRAIPLSSKHGATDRATGAAPIFAPQSLPVVIDADGLNWLAKQENWYEHLPAGRAVLTPHPAEMGRLLGIEVAEVMEHPVQCAIDAAKLWKQTVVLKSGYTIATDGKQTLIAEDAPVALATAGSGDVFAGTIGALLAQGLKPLDAAALAIYAGSRAAHLAAESFGDLGVLAIDLPDAVARAMKELQ